jgi:hypothetical protein
MSGGGMIVLVCIGYALAVFPAAYAIGVLDATSSVDRENGTLLFILGPAALAIFAIICLCLAPFYGLDRLYSKGREHGARK